MKNPYLVLGVDKTATEDAIRSAYRKLAKTHHPDVNPGKPEAAERFKEISHAYSLLSDAEKRSRYDRGEIDESGAERQPERPSYRDFGDRHGRSKYRAEADLDPADLDEFFARAFSQRQQGQFAMRGQDEQYTLSVDFLDAATGTKRRLTLPDGGVLDVTIPEGLQDGQTLRLKGKGGPGRGGAPAGDALIEVSVTPHRLFRRDGDDIVVELPVTLKEAVLGAKIAVPTIKGSVALTIPPSSSSGTRLRLKGRGIRGGHQFVELKVVLPPASEPELAAFLEAWEPKNPLDPRKDMMP